MLKEFKQEQIKESRIEVIEKEIQSEKKVESSSQDDKDKTTLESSFHKDKGAYNRMK